jgi:hypothetical protein
MNVIWGSVWDTCSRWTTAAAGGAARRDEHRQYRDAAKDYRGRTRRLDIECD